MDVERSSIKLGLLTRKERDWLLGDINVSKPYEYRLKNGIRKNLQTFIEFEFPLLSKSGLLPLIANQSSYYHQKEQLEPWMGLGDLLILDLTGPVIETT